MLAVSKFRNGDRLSVGADIPCGKCEQCLAQRANCCETNLAMGYQFDGGFAEFVKLEAGVVEHGPVHAFGVDLPFGLAALAEPLACCINGYQRCLYESGGTVVVFGAGPMGAMLAMYGRYKGASQIITVEPSHSRRAWAKEFTSDEVIDPSHDDTVARIMDLTGGMGAEAIFTACASTTAHEQAIAVVARRGVVNLFGGLPKSAPPIALASNHIHYREAYLTGSHGSTPQQHEMALRMIESGEFDVSKLISEELPLEELPRFVSEGPTDGVIKAIVRP